MDKNFDFAGWATKNDLRCFDGRTIRSGAFKDMDGKTVPIVWSHGHGDIRDVVGHALLENRAEGVYAYGYLNDEVPNGKIAKSLVKHGDINSLSIYANGLKYANNDRTSGDVVHGTIREVSLVLSGANPGAYIEEVLQHSAESNEMIPSGEYQMFTGEVFSNLECLEHAESDDGGDVVVTNDANNTKPNDSNDDKTIEDVLSDLTDDQMKAVYVVVGSILDKYDIDPTDSNNDNDNDDSDSDEEDNVKHNVFDGETTLTHNDDALVHSALEEIVADAKAGAGRSLKDTFVNYVNTHQEDGTGDALMHAATYGVQPVDVLFPEPKAMTARPEFIQRDMGWVSRLMGSVHHTPFSRVKSVFADITEDEARARGYIKGKLKKDEVFTLLKRTTSPTMVYKRQKMDRQDIIDITDFDVVAWLKSEMRMMLDEEIARAILISDGRNTASDDKINEDNVRPIWTDSDLYTIKAGYTIGDTTDADAEAFIDTAIRARKDYKGSGNPILFTTEENLTNMLLLKDKIGHYMYDSVTALATRLRVREIVTVEVMENQTRMVESTKHTLRGIIVNPVDYNVGADRGGEVNMFDDFDIDYNQQKYLIETYISGALIKPYSAIAIEALPKA